VRARGETPTVRPQKPDHRSGDPRLHRSGGDGCARPDQLQRPQRSLERDLDLFGQYEAWRARRDDFNARLYKRDPGAVKEAWQRYYFKGEMPDDSGPPPKAHANKRRMKALRLGG